MELQKFGGNWTDKKLRKLKKYLHAYATIMSKYKFQYAYIDAFAGTGYRTTKQGSKDENPFFLQEIFDQDSERFIDGSAKNWHKKVSDLKVGSRAVLFLDPFGMQVPWETIEAIARTEAIDLWYLFPVGIAINRLLKRDGNISESIKERLNPAFLTQSTTANSKSLGIQGFDLSELPPVTPNSVLFLQ